MAEDATTLLARVFERDQALADAIQTLLASDRASVVSALTAAAQGGGDESEESDRRLVRIAAIVSELDGRAAAELALGLLDSRSPVVRAAAGEALLDLAVDGADSVVEAAASAVAQTELSRALMELPYLLAEIAHRRSAEVVGRLLAHADPAVVASAIDAAVLLADVALVPALQKLAKDRRVVTLSDDDGEQSAPIAELASDALGEISPGAKDRARKR